jgi:hypothetical protein
MMHEHESQVNEAKAPKSPNEREGAEAPLAAEAEFKITVRKLQFPVRPRGVLAE